MHYCPGNNKHIYVSHLRSWMNEWMNESFYEACVNEGRSKGRRYVILGFGSTTLAGGRGSTNPRRTGTRVNWVRTGWGIGRSLEWAGMRNQALRQLRSRCRTDFRVFPTLRSLCTLACSSYTRIRANTDIAGLPIPSLKIQPPKGSFWKLCSFCFPYPLSSPNDRLILYTTRYVIDAADVHTRFILLARWPLPGENRETPLKLFVIYTTYPYRWDLKLR